MKVIGKYFIVQKHMKRNGKLHRRRFNEQEEMERMKTLAAGYAEEHSEDFLIVQVVAEVSKPTNKEG